MEEVKEQKEMKKTQVDGHGRNQSAQQGGS